jgi:hypothetical protein
MFMAKRDQSHGSDDPPSISWRTRLPLRQARGRRSPGDLAEILMVRRLDERQVALTFAWAGHQVLAADIAASCSAPARNLVHAVHDGFDMVAVEEDLAHERRIGLAVANHNILGSVTAFLPCRSAGGERPRKRLFGSFERFLTDTICPKGPRHARDGGRPHFAGGWTQWPVPVRRPSRHAADPKPPSRTRGDSCARNPCQFASMSVARLGAKTTPWLGRDLDEERLEHPPGLLGPRFDGAAHPAHVAGGRARIS